MAISRSMMERQLRAGGGIMTLDEPRQGYFLGKIVRKAKKAVKKVVKSPLGKAAILGAGIYGLGGGFGPAGFSKALLKSRTISPFLSGGKLSTLGDIFRVGGEAGAGFSVPRILGGLGIGASIAAPFLMGGDEEEIDEGVDVTGIQPMVADIRNQAREFYRNPASRADSGLFFMPSQQFVQPSFYAAGGGLADIPREGYRVGGGVMSMLGKAGDAIKNLKNALITKLGRMTDDVEITTMSDFAEDTGASMDLSFVPKSKKGRETLDSLVKDNILDVSDGVYTPKPMLDDDAILGMEKLKASGVIEEGGDFVRFDQGAGMGEYGMPYAGYDQLIETFGRQKKAEGGLMDLGGFEKDYREGGFVPLGAEERADDVPARLSKNEFVFTADAVRNAGGGDIDKGAEVMQNMMDNLEAGGTISEESQGKENPAQAMFDQAQQLESRIA